MYNNDIDMATNDLEKEFLDMIEAQKRVIYKVCYIYAQDGDDLKAYLSCWLSSVPTLSGSRWNINKGNSA